jgi:Carboxypeptidase regulatory-like domain
MTLIRNVQSVVRSSLTAVAMGSVICAEACAQAAPPASSVGSGQVEMQRSPALQQRVPRQLPSISALQGRLVDNASQPLGGVTVSLSPKPGPCAPSQKLCGESDADGIFRVLQVPAGDYPLTFTVPGGASFQRGNVHIGTGEVLSIQVQLPVERAAGPASVIPRAPAEINDSLYRELSRHAINDGSVVPPMLRLSPDDMVYLPKPDRWNTSMPDYRRYPDDVRSPYVLGHWYDPFNRNKYKGDYPVLTNILGPRTFFNFTGSSTTALDGRRLPTPSNEGSASPDSAPFFGKGGQFFLAQVFRLSFDLFKGDAAFRPIDWQVRFTPAFNLNYLATQENGIVNANVAKGTDRFDEHIGLQEAFVEVKLKDLSPNYDFISIRAGIQQFSSDFRGFIFADENNGVRVFGNLRSNRFQYNAAFFDLLEKNTNSGLNTFQRRYRQVGVANLYIQDAGFKGYTTEFSFDWSNDDPTIHFDDNDFQVRPAPIGTVVVTGPIPHSIRSYYIGWTGDGHIDRIDINHAFYQALGHDTFNPLAARKVDINAQLAALELSIDEDWLRFRGSFLYASGDANPRGANSRIARGFDSIVDNESFAGGEFSFFNREGIRLTGTGVGLTSPDSFLPDLNASKDEGQSNFVNPGIYVVNAGVDAKLTPTLKMVTNVNYLRFVRTEPLELLLFQNPIRHGIGMDASTGVIWRPPLSDNIIITGGIAVLPPALGLREIYQSKTLLSGFGTIRYQF